MLISLRQLVDRTRHPRSRADELARLRARHRAQSPSAEQVAVARRLRELRVAFDEAIGEVQACRSCAKGHPAPEGHWPGGHCCGGDTLTIFSPDEVASLKAAGTRVGDWKPPRGDHAGCAFRGERGCSLAPEHRPSICLEYICLDLRKELLAGEDGRRLLAIAGELRAGRARFSELGGNDVADYRRRSAASASASASASAASSSAAASPSVSSATRSFGK